MVYPVPPFVSDETPLWEPDKLPALMEGLERLAAARERGPDLKPGKNRKALESYGDSMDAFASIIVPADPDVPGDKAAGELGLDHHGHGSHEGRFFEQMLRFIRLGFVADIGLAVSEDDAEAVFEELDRQARRPGIARFEQLTTAQQQEIVEDLLDGTLGTALQTQGRLMVFTVKLAYWLNFPEHRVRKGPLGFGEGEVVFSDHKNKISNPNEPGTGTAWDYVGWHYPQRAGVEAKNALAFLDANVPENAAASEEALAELLAKDADRTLIFEP